METKTPSVTLALQFSATPSWDWRFGSVFVGLHPGVPAFSISAGAGLSSQYDTSHNQNLISKGPTRLYNVNQNGGHSSDFGWELPHSPSTTLGTLDTRPLRFAGFPSKACLLKILRRHCDPGKITCSNMSYLSVTLGTMLS